jgi:hypothetical protein
MFITHRDLGVEALTRLHLVVLEWSEPRERCARLALPLELQRAHAS